MSAAVDSCQSGRPLTLACLTYGHAFASGDRGYARVYLQHACTAAECVHTGLARAWVDDACRLLSCKGHDCRIRELAASCLYPMYPAFPSHRLVAGHNPYTWRTKYMPYSTHGNWQLI